MNALLPTTPDFLNEKKKKSAKGPLKVPAKINEKTLDLKEITSELPPEVPLNTTPLEETKVPLEHELIDLAPKILLKSSIVKVEAPSSIEYLPPAVEPPVISASDFGAEPEGLPWKDIFREVPDSYQLLVQREWGLLTERVRGLAPETEWSFLWIGEINTSKVIIAKWRSWIEKLICSSFWETPRQVDITLTNKDGLPTFVMKLSKEDLPPPIFPKTEGWRILPSSTENHYCFTISYRETFVSCKAGTT